MSQRSLKARIASFPETSGVYLMKDKKRNALYIGKAKNLHSRVSSYLHPSRNDPRTPIQVMWGKVAHIDYIATDTEVDALLLEARLIKDLKPKYNVQLKDDKSYPYLAITKTDDFPKVLVTREVDAHQADYYGPFTDVDGLREAVKHLQHVFKFATCTLSILEGDPKRRFFRPCLLHSINRCTAPCAAKISKDDYAETLDGVRKFLSEDKSAFLHELKGKMKRSAQHQEYEKAALYRDQMKTIESLSRRPSKGTYLEGDITPLEPQSALEDLMHWLKLNSKPRTIDGIDISHVAGSDAVGSIVTFVDGIPFKNGYRQYKIKTIKEIDDYAMMREVIHRRFKRLMQEEASFPDILLIDGGLGHLQSVAQELQRLTPRLPLLLALAKQNEQLFTHGKNRPLGLDKSSLGLRLLMYVRDEAHRFAQHYHHILRHKRLRSHRSRLHRLCLEESVL